MKKTKGRGKGNQGHLNIVLLAGMSALRYKQEELERVVLQLAQRVDGLVTVLVDMADPDSTRVYPGGNGAKPIQGSRTAQPGGITTRHIFIPVARIREADTMWKRGATLPGLDRWLGFDVNKTHGNVAHELLVRNRAQWEHMQPTEKR